MLQNLNKKIIKTTLLLFLTSNLYSDEIKFYKNQIIDLSKYGENIEVSTSKIKYDMLNYKYSENVEKCKIVEKSSLICNIDDNDSFYILLDIYKNGNKISKDIKLTNVPYVSSIRNTKQSNEEETGKVSLMKVEEIKPTVILNRKTNQPIPEKTFVKNTNTQSNNLNENEEMKVLNLIIQEQKNELEKLRKNSNITMSPETMIANDIREEEIQNNQKYDYNNFTDKQNYENLKIDFDKYKNNVKEKIILVKKQYDYDMNKNEEMIENLKKMIELKSNENAKQNNIINDLNKKIKEQNELLQLKDIAVQNFQ